MRPQPSTLARALSYGALAGLAGLAYASIYEVNAFMLRRVEMPVLPPGSRPIKVLHLSDIHMTPWQHKKQRWVRDLARLQPDLVVTGSERASQSSTFSCASALPIASSSVSCGCAGSGTKGVPTRFPRES